MFLMAQKSGLECRWSSLLTAGFDGWVDFEQRTLMVRPASTIWPTTARKEVALEHRSCAFQASVRIQGASAVAITSHWTEMSPVSSHKGIPCPFLLLSAFRLRSNRANTDLSMCIRNARLEYGLPSSRRMTPGRGHAGMITISASSFGKRRHTTPCFSQSHPGLHSLGQCLMVIISSFDPAANTVLRALDFLIPGL